MVREWCCVLSRMLLPVASVAILLVCPVMVGLIDPPNVVGETATVGWTRQFATGGDDSARGVSAVDGSIYVGEFRGDPYPDESYVHKYDAAGSELWISEVNDTRVNGLYDERLDAMYACSSGIYVAMTGLYGGPDGDGGAAGLLKYSSSGAQGWVSAIGIDSINMPVAVFADSGGIYVAGSAVGMGEGERGFVRKYDSSGTILWTKEYSADPDYYPRGVSAYSGSVYVAGVVSGSGESFVRKHDSAGTELWTRLPGFAPPVVAKGVSADSSGVYVAGVAHGASEVNGLQAFVRKYDHDGNNLWTREFGSSEDDGANAIFVNSSGIHVAGYTEGALPGQTNNGGADAFVRKYNTSGDEVWTYQFGSSADDTATSISADATGIYAAGETDGTMPGLTSSGGQDAFVMRIATNSPPSQPTNVSPIDAATGVSVTPTLQSSAFSDPDAGDTHIASQWQVRTSGGDYSGPAYDSGTAATHLTSISVPAAELDYSTTYYWHVRHQDSDSVWSSWSTESGFTTLPLASAPSVTTNAATSIGTDSATLNGNLTSLGTADNVWVSFEWGLTDSYGSTTTPQGPMWAPGGWSYPVSGLTPGTTYHFRAKADGGDGIAYGSDMTFTTATVAMSVTTNAATSIGTSSAMLNGNLTSLGTAGNVWVSFEWGLTDSYGSTTTLQGPMWAPGAWSYPLSGLTPGTTYHFRAKVDGGGATAYGSDLTFTTATAAMSVTTNAATSIGTSSAMLNGNLTSLGTADNVWVSFEWGLTDSYGSTTTLQGPMWAPGAWSYPLSGLTPGTTYHFRAKVDGDGATAYGLDMTFTTGQIPEIEDVDPDSGKRNRDLTVTISGSHLDGATAVSFGSGITVEDFVVNSSTEITADITIDADATLGDRDVSVTTEWGTGTKPDAFSVTGGGGGICGTGAPTTPNHGSEMAIVLAALGLLFGVAYMLVRIGAKSGVRV